LKYNTESSSYFEVFMLAADIWPIFPAYILQFLPIAAALLRFFFVLAAYMYVLGTFSPTGSIHIFCNFYTAGRSRFAVIA
jgi:hypothetical protein